MTNATAAERAIALPLWEWLPGMLSVETTPEHRLRRRRILQTDPLVDHWGKRVPFVQLEMEGWRPLSTFHALPDFTDLITLHGLHALVMDRARGQAHGKTRAHANGSNDLALLLVEALEAAP